MADRERQSSGLGGGSGSDTVPHAAGQPTLRTTVGSAVPRRPRRRRQHRWASAPVPSPASARASSPSRRPRGYWLSEQNLIREVRQFVAERAQALEEDGVPLMPSHLELRCAGRCDLLRAIDRSGGFAYVANQCGYRTRQLPHGHWRHHFQNVAQAVQTFMQQHPSSLPPSPESPLRLPTAAELRARGQHSLVLAIAMHGGSTAVAARLGLRNIRRRGYLRDADDIQRELQQWFPQSIARHRRAPRSQEVRRARRYDVNHAIIRYHGGYTRLAAALNLCRSLPYRRPPFYWRDPARLHDEMRAFARATLAGGRMPLQRELLAMGRGDLIYAIRIHGGIDAVAVQLGWARAPSVRRNARGHWASLDNLRTELNAFVNENCYPGMMPRMEYLRSCGKNDLVYAIRRHGGPAAVAGRLHLFWFGPSTFWRRFDNLRKRLRAFMAKSGLSPRLMPLQEELVRAGRFDLVYGVNLHGGVYPVARRMGMRVQVPRRPRFYWNSLAHVERELDAFLMNTQPSGRGHREHMPTSAMLLKAGRRDVAAAIRRHGGWDRLARQLGLKPAYEKRRKGYWNDLHNVCSELQVYLRQLEGWGPDEAEMADACAVVPGGGGVSGRDAAAASTGVGSASNHQAVSYAPAHCMPTAQELRLDGRADLVFACERIHGGLENVARRLGWSTLERRLPAGVLKRNFELLRTELLRWWIPKYGVDGEMPRPVDFERTHRFDVHEAILAHGGYERVASVLDLAYEGPAAVRDAGRGWTPTAAGAAGVVA